MSAYSDRVIADGASYYWRLGETVGTTAVDSVGGANGTISGGVTLGAAGAIGDGDKAMTFNGTTGQILTASTLTFATVFTIEAWVRSNQGSAQGIVETFSGGPIALSLDIDSTKIVASSYVYTGGASGSLFSNRIVNDGLWHHVVLTIDSGIWRIYIDGTQDNTTSIAAFPVPVQQRIYLGNSNIAVRFLNGALDEVAIYPRALTAPEIAAHYTLASSAGRPLAFGYYKQVWSAA